MSLKGISIIKSLLPLKPTVRSLHGGISYASCPGEVPLLPLTAGQLLEKTVEKHPDKDAFIFPSHGVRYSYQQLLQKADNFAAGLQALGIKRGDRVGIWAPNIPEWTMTQYAVWRLGAILVNLNPSYPGPELQYALNLTKSSVVVCASRWKTQDYWNILHSLAPQLADVPPRPTAPLSLPSLPNLTRLVFVSKDPPPGSYTLSDVLSMATPAGVAAIRDAQKEIQFDDKCNIVFTSGTTGRPKGATLSHHGIVNNGYFTGRRLDAHLQPEARICSPLPMYHLYPAVMFSLAVVSHGITGVVPAEAFTAESTLRAVHTERCTIMYGTPTTYIDMLNHPLLSGGSLDITSLDSGICAAAPCPVPLMRNIIDKLHISKLIVAYGSTELSPVCHANKMTDSIEVRTSTVGCTIDHLESKIIDPNGKVVPIGEQGEICVRGYSVMHGYWNDEEHTREVIGADRFYRTGDLGIMDADGNLRVVGRLKDLIVRGGSKVFPAEVEQVLHRHPALKDAHVVGVPDERLGEQVCACICLKPGASEPTADEIRTFCREHLAAYKVPKYVLVVDAFPTTLSGKVQKFILREEATRRLGIAHIKTHLQLAQKS